jgi:hypothetical protein
LFVNELVKAKEEHQRSKAMAIIISSANGGTAESEVKSTLMTRPPFRRFDLVM